MSSLIVMSEFCGLIICYFLPAQGTQYLFDKATAFL